MDGETFQSVRRMTGSGSIKALKIHPESLLRLIKQHAAGIPMDTELVSVQVKDPGKAGVFHVVRLRVKTGNAMLLPKQWAEEPDSQKRNMHIFFNHGPVVSAVGGK